MLKKISAFVPRSPQITSLTSLGELLTVFMIIVSPGASLSLLVSPSSSIQAMIDPSPSLSSSYAAAFTTSQSSSPAAVQPTISPLPIQHTCTSGPEFIRASGTITTTDRIYLDLSQPVNCTGVITSWYFCHYIIGYRDIPSGLWPCVWRRSNDSSGYEKIGCNKIQLLPGGKVNELKCRQFVPSNPSDFISVEEGDYIGFYIPDVGLFVGLSSSIYDEGNYQLERNVTGFSDFIEDSELRNTTDTPGRALLSAEIGQ